VTKLFKSWNEKLNFKIKLFHKISPLAGVFAAGDAGTLSSEAVSLACETSLEVRPNSAQLLSGLLFIILYL
jgi:hypothetical protein